IDTCFAEINFSVVNPPTAMLDSSSYCVNSNGNEVILKYRFNDGIHDKFIFKVGTTQSNVSKSYNYKYQFIMHPDSLQSVDSNNIFKFELINDNTKCSIDIIDTIKHLPIRILI
ncbi:MAG: hypothetical protein IPQ02_14705, partial [Saprospiraceae bacterium]|nr:hypothetical protein [Candidatus Defluviibacterium haderslevense]